MKILVATSNPHKLAEIRAVLATERRPQAGKGGPRMQIELVGLDQLDESIPEPVEDQDTFEGNATLKARHYANASGLLCLADDSGLEVDALGGEPGVHSARYSGIKGPRSVVDPANNRLLLERMAHTPSQRRTARFVCVMALVAPADPHGLPIQVEAHDPKGPVLAIAHGTVEGQILTIDDAADPSAPELGRGTNGFGYDPLFLLPELGKTSGQISPEKKNTLSHRANAARQMWQLISQLVAD